MTDSAPSTDAAPAPGERAQPSPFDTMLKTAFAPSLGAGIVTAVVVWIAAGGRAGLSAGFGAALALVFFTAGLLVMRRVLDLNAVTLMAAAMAVFFGQLILVILVMVAATNALDLRPTATFVGVLVVILVWQIFQVLGFVRSRRPVYDAPSAGGEAT